jgi:hypothetical protein
MMTTALLAFALASVPPVPEPSVVRRAELFTEADCRRHAGLIVSFEGRVEDMDGVGDLYRIVLRGNRPGRQWQALLPRDEWLRYSPGDWISISGRLTLNEAEGEFFATIHVLESVPAGD